MQGGVSGHRVAVQRMAVRCGTLPAVGMSRAVCCVLCAVCCVLCAVCCLCSDVRVCGCALRCVLCVVCVRIPRKARRDFCALGFDGCTLQPAHLRVWRAGVVYSYLASPRGPSVGRCERVPCLAALLSALLPCWRVAALLPCCLAVVGSALSHGWTATQPAASGEAATASTTATEEPPAGPDLHGRLRASSAADVGPV
jgi:hypothetical protein